ncbi:retrovirus-related pol polyprotein from transposon TNT 1-94 [Tanacetum coccineum]
MTVVKQYLHRYLKEPGPKVVFEDDSLGDTEGYGLINCNGITFTRVAYVNGFKHNLNSISQLCDANFKVLFKKTHGTIFKQKDKVVLIAPRRINVYVIDMSSFNKDCNACFFAKALPIHVRKGSITKPHSKQRDHFPSTSLYISFTWIYLDLLNLKPSATTNILLKMENLNEVRVKELGSDNGTEFKNHKLEEFYDEKVKRHGKTTYDVFRGRSPGINYFHVFRCPVHIHNHRDHLGKFDEKADDGFFLGYSSVAKAFRVFNIRRQEVEEIVHITFSEDDEAISQTSTEGDAINFNENRSFPDDEFIEPRSKDTQCFVNIEYFCYVSAYENITLAVLPTLQNFVTSEEPHEFMITDNLPDTHEHDHAESADILESDEPQDNVLSESISDDQPTPVILPSE